MIKINQDILTDFNRGRELEWLETNGLGGYAGSSIVGTHTRRYHGLLVAATAPPAERMVLLSKLDETVIIGKKRFELGANLFSEDIIHPEGNLFLESFSKDLFPQWVYKIGEVTLQKQVIMLHGENSTLISYEVLESAAPFTLELLPLVAGRGYHELMQEGEKLHWDVSFENGIFHNKPDGEHHLYINIPGGDYKHDPRWFRRFMYSVEQYRGLDHSEDLLNHGLFTVKLKEADRLGIIISTEDPSGRNANELIEKEISRRLKLLEGFEGDDTTRQLILAADQFIVERKVAAQNGDAEEDATIIAGYHWFADWGRDTMISLPGICLSTGRYDDAKKILRAFARSVSQGMLPNRFQDNGEPPEYNNVDGTLWYFISIYKYLEATGDWRFVVDELLPVLKEIVDWHYRGTRYNIRVDDDGLLFAGEIGQQLTWMDARIGSWVVTPRMGKPVEIQALWYNAQKIFAELLRLNGQETDARLVELSAAKTKENFAKKFWYSQGEYLLDNIDENKMPDSTLRPNQLFALSLPFALIDDEWQATKILAVIEKELYTPVGLRSLPAADAHYIPFYGGNQWHRDSAYHEGTIWSWLMGAYVDAWRKLPGGEQKASEITKHFKFHLAEGCIGSVSEIFDASAPYHPRGCVAQAWGVGEWLRVMHEVRVMTPSEFS